MHSARLSAVFTLLDLVQRSQISQVAAFDRILVNYWANCYRCSTRIVIDKQRKALL